MAGAPGYGQDGAGAPGTPGLDGAGGVGVRLEGNKARIINEKTIAGGLSGDGITRARAVDITGDDNTVELRSGYDFTGNVFASGTGNTLRLGGDSDAEFDVSKIKATETAGVFDEYVGFEAYEKTGDSTWTLKNSTTETTAWTVSGGLLNFASADAFGTDAPNITLNGGGLQWAAGTTTDISSRLAALGTDGGTFDTNGNDVTLATSIEGGGLIKKGDGTLTVTSANTYTGTTTVEAGALHIGDGGTSGSVASASIDVSGAAAVVLNRSDAVMYSGVVSGAGNLTKKGSGTLILTGTNTSTGTTTVEAGALQIGDGVTGGSIESGSVAVAGTAALIFNRSDTVTYAGRVSGEGTLVKRGAGGLTLTAENSHTGETFVSEGTLALSGTGAIAASSGLTMAGSTSFDISAIAGDSTSVAALTISGTGTSIADSGNGKTLTIDGDTITFDIGGVAAGETMLAANGTLVTTAATTIVLAGTPTLQQGQTVILVDGVDAASAFTDALDIRYGRYSYDITLSGLNIVLGGNGYITFREDSDTILEPAGLNNVNIATGGDYLDRLDAASDPFLPTLSAAYDLATIGRAPDEAAIALQQLYGGYAAYASNALDADATRFRHRWQGQNRSFFDSRMVSGQFAGSVTSDDALAAPAHGVRDRIACGQSRIWAGGGGAWAKQDGKNNLPGYTYDSDGAVLGYEYTFGDLNLGVAAAYSRGDLKVKDLRYKNEADVLNLALYGAYLHDSGVYLEGGLGYGHAWNDYTVHSIATPGGSKKAKYGSDAFTADLNLGYIARLPRDINFIPSVGVDYTHIRNGAWSENVNTAALVANRFDSGHDNRVDIPLGVRFTRLYRFGDDGGHIVPEVRASYVYTADRSRPSITAGYAGTSGGVEMIGVVPGRSHWRVGAGLSGRIGSRVDFRVEYDFETRSGFRGHTLNASVGLSF
ncbi:MAG: autotransporter domain-containing protein [Planctomycetes bacterium]|nr:autotransporter domain-containing protein [Planctomycetota bacterium]